MHRGVCIVFDLVVLRIASGIVDRSVRHDVLPVNGAVRFHHTTDEKRITCVQDGTVIQHNKCIITMV